MEIAMKSLRLIRSRWTSMIWVWLAALTTTAHGESLLLQAGTVHPVSGPALQPGQVWIRDGKVVAVSSSVDAPGATAVNLGSLHLYPGLLAATTSLGLSEIEAVRSTQDTTEVGRFTPEIQAWIAVNPDSELLPVARANGIAFIAPVPQGGWVSGQSGLVALQGWTTESMVRRKPIALHVNWPDMNLDLTPKDHLKDKSKWKSPEDLAKERRKSLEEFTSFFQDAAAYAKARRSSQPPELNPSWESMIPYLEGQRPMVIHAEDVRQIRAAAEWARTNQFRWVLAGARDAVKVASLLASNQVPVIYEHVYDRPYRDTDPYDATFSAAAALHSAGVSVSISLGTSGMNETWSRNLPYYVAQCVAFGLPAEEGLKSMTLNPAKALGISDMMGSIEVGKEATLFASTGDVMDIRSQVVRMWISGQEIDLQTRHTRLYEKYRSRPKTP